VGSPHRLTGRATDKWQILLGTASHGRHFAHTLPQACIFLLCVLVFVHSLTSNCVNKASQTRKIHAGEIKINIEIEFHSSIVLELWALVLL
jgi:hypothetical protein